MSGRMVRHTRLIYEFGPFRLIPEERQLLRDDQPVPLTPKSFDLLVVLVENSGHLLEKDDLLKRIWPDIYVEEANLSVNVSALRRMLGESPNEHQFIETVPRRGYRFAAGVKEGWDGGTQPAGDELSEEGDDSDPVADSELQTSPPSLAAPSRMRLSFRRWTLVLVGLLAVSALLLGLNAGGLRERLPGKGEPASIQSLAVLPLENLSGDPAQDYFAEGMTEALFTDLAKLGAMRVMSPSAVTQYQGASKKPLAEIGRELNVEAVLTGSVVRDDGRVRISVQLIHAVTGRNLWAKSYERDMGDVLALQREVARDVVGGVSGKLGPQEQVQAGSVRPVNPEVYDLYLRGRFYLNRQTRGDNEAAITALERAVDADPTFAALDNLRQGARFVTFLAKLK